MFCLVVCLVFAFLVCRLEKKAFKNLEVKIVARVIKKCALLEQRLCPPCTGRVDGALTLKANNRRWCVCAAPRLQQSGGGWWSECFCLWCWRSALPAVWCSAAEMRCFRGQKREARIIPLLIIITANLRNKHLCRIWFVFCWFRMFLVIVAHTHCGCCVCFWFCRQTCVSLCKLHKTLSFKHNQCSTCSVYTDPSRRETPNQHVSKCFDDTILLSLCSDTHQPGLHQSGVNKMVEWGDNHALETNTTETEEIAFGSPSDSHEVPNIILQRQN